MSKNLSEETPGKVVAAQGYGMRQLFRRPSPSPAEAEATLPYPPQWPKVAVQGNLTHHRFWPGGVIVVPAYAFKTGNATLGSPGTGAFAASGIYKNQVSADFASADSIVEFTPEDIGLPTDMPYTVQVGMRFSAAGATNAGVRISPKGTSGAGTDFGYGRAMFTTSIAHTYYGLFRFIYTRGFASGGYVKYFDPGETITFKAYRTAGSSCDIWIDNIYFFPAGFQPDAPTSHNDYTANVSYQAPSDGYPGPTADAQSADYADGGGANGSAMIDTQARSSYRDPDLTFTAFCWSSGFEDSAGNIARSTYGAWDAFHPRHMYALARVKHATEGYNDPFAAAGFISIEGDTFPASQAPLWTDSWGMIYLGMVPFRSTFELQLTSWLAATGDGDPTDPPWCYTAIGGGEDLEQVEVETVWFMSSINDWLHYADGGRAYLPNPYSVDPIGDDNIVYPNRD